MHIPDGFLNAPVSLTTAILAVTGLTIAIRDIKKHLPEHHVPLIGLSAAFIFAAQMLNFPVAAGTSGHLVGATLVAILLGPSAATLVISAVLILQCLMFADGGITALGANIFNLGVVAPIIGFCAYRFILRITQSETLFHRLFATAFSSWISMVIAAVFCSIELALSHAAAIQLVLPAMTVVHMFIGLGEAAITAFVVANILRLRPELFFFNNHDNDPEQSNKSFYALSLLVSLALAIFIAPFASQSPDGLEFVAEQVGFINNASVLLTQVPLPDYNVPGIDNMITGSLVVGTIGTLVAFILAWGFAHWLSRRS